MTHPMVGVIWKRWVIVSGSSNLSYQVSVLLLKPQRLGLKRTGTLRWVMTTEVSFPRTATAVTPDPVIALKAYSAHQLERHEQGS